MVTFNFRYFLLTILFLITEIFIALYVRDKLVRPYIGDVLVVILLYCFLRSFLKISVVKALLLVIGFTCLVEFLQYLKTIKLLQLEHSSIATTIIGSSFSWIDLGMYFSGGVIILLVENMRKNRKA